MRAKLVGASNDPTGFYGVRFNCPCGLASVLPAHWLPEGYDHQSAGTEQLARWQFNGNLLLPTFSPSILKSIGPLDDEDVCKYYGERVGFKFSVGSTFVCHSFVNDGRIQFLGDCTHRYANQTLDLPEIGVEYNEV